MGDPKESIDGETVTNPTGSSGRAWLRFTDSRALSDEQERQLDAIFDRILPADSDRGVPGAVRARASRFVSLLLSKDSSVYEEIPEWQSNYRIWLQALETYAQQSHGKPLTGIGTAALDSLVQGLETGAVVGLDAAVDQKKMFKTLYRHCLQGCFSDPRWGGNHERLMWRWVGYLQLPEEV